MKLSCLQENLSKGLGIVSRAVATRTTLPITQNVLLQTDQGRLKLSATNLEIALSTWIGAKVEGEGAITVPARLLTEFAGTLPNERVDMEASQRPWVLALSCARVAARMNGTDAEEFPPIPKVEAGIATKVQCKELRSAISRAVFAAATDDSRPVLTGVKVELTEGRLTLAAADGFRLAVHHGSLAEPVSDPTHFIVPARSLNEVSRLLGEDDEAVELVVAAAKGQLLFRLKSVELVSQLIQGTFPNYGQLIPQKYSTRATVGVREFLRATRTASIFARDGSGIIRLHMVPGSPGMLKVVARAEEVGENAEEMDAKVEGEEARIAFDSRYLRDVLSAIGEGEVYLDVTTASSPGVFRPAGSESYIHVVMPMFVQW